MSSNNAAGSHFDNTQTWALILAGGEGSRLRALTTRPCGTAVPKQFCSLHGGHTLLEDAMIRAAALVPADKICTIVAQQHREWWARVLAAAPRQNIIVQPRNRGTAIGILYSLLHILARDPHARIVMLPADHYVRDEAILRQSLCDALMRLDKDDRYPVLLGLEPDEHDTELGYILPGAGDSLGGRRVARFVEKPPLAVVRQIIDEGGLWNAFIIAASAQRMLDMFTQSYAPLVLEMRIVMQRALSAGLPADAGWARLTQLYDRLPEVDFSRDFLEGREASLRVVRVPPCGWSDLGTPKRVAETLRRIDIREHELEREDDSSSVLINLAARHAAMERIARVERRA